MPTDKQRVSVVLEDDLYEQLEEYRFSNRITSLSKAVSQLIELAIMCKNESQAILIEADSKLEKELHAYALEKNMDSLGDAARELICFGLLEMNNNPPAVSGSHAIARDEMRLIAHFLTGTPEQRSAIIETVTRIIYPERRYTRQPNSVVVNAINEALDRVVEAEVESSSNHASTGDA